MLLVEDTRLHVLGHATVAIERAARRDDILAVDTVAKLLLARYLRCEMSFDELRDRMIVLAARRGVTLEFGSGDGLAD
jgi:hypothetical protein